MKTDAQACAEQPTPDDLRTLVRSLVCEVTGAECQWRNANRADQVDCETCHIAAYCSWLADGIELGRRWYREADSEKLSGLLLRAKCEKFKESPWSRVNREEPCTCKTCEAFRRLKDVEYNVRMQKLYWLHVQTLAKSLKCLECGGEAPCMLGNHGTDGDPLALCTCETCVVAARCLWIADGLRFGGMRHCEIDHGDVGDLLALARCETSGAPCSERQPSAGHAGCLCASCSAWWNVRWWLYEGPGVVSDERRAG